jgi:hypothetical protein
MATAVGTDVDQVVAVATDYLKSFYSGTAEERAARMQRVIHPDLAKRSPANIRADGTFYEWTLAEMIEIASNSVNEPVGTPYKVQVLDRTDRMASVRTDAVWGIDYMHLARIDGEWRVVNVLWDEPDRPET